MTQPAVILCIDTSGTRCDVALVQETTVLAQKTVVDRHAHSEKLIGLIDACLSEAGISREKISSVAVTIGPGSFTGLRVGLSAAKGIALSLSIPIIGIPTHDVVANMLPPTDLLWVTNTAKKGHFYWTAYSAGKPTGGCRMISATELVTYIAGETTIATDHPEWISSLLDSMTQTKIRLMDETMAFPDAAALGRMAAARLKSGRVDSVQTLMPIYVQSFQGVM